MWDPFAQFESAVLPNGLTIHVLHLPNVAGVYMDFGIHSGARHDLPGKEGAAHYMEHLVNCNGGSSAEDIKEFFDSNTGHSAMLGSTSFYWTKYGFHSSAQAPLLSRSLELFGNMLLHARLENHMERERAVIEGEFRQHYPTDVRYVLAERINQMAFSNTVLSRMDIPLGTLDSIRSMTERDLQHFYDAHYTPRNMQIVAVGELPLSIVVNSIIASPFNAEKRGERSAAVMPFAETPLPNQVLEVFKLGEHVQGMSTAEYLSVAQLPDRYSIPKIGVVWRMLKERLFYEIRQRRSWTYSIGSQHSGYGGDFRQFLIRSQGLALEAVDEIEEVITECIDTLPKQHELFERARVSGINSIRFGNPSAAAIGDKAMDELMAVRHIVTLAEDLYETETVTLEDVASIVQHLSRERRFTSIRVP